MPGGDHSHDFDEQQIATEGLQKWIQHRSKNHLGLRCWGDRFHHVECWVHQSGDGLKHSQHELDMGLWVGRESAEYEHVKKVLSLFEKQGSGKGRSMLRDRVAEIAVVDKLGPLKPKGADNHDMIVEAFESLD